MNRYVIETKQITKTYNPRSPFIALDHVDLHVSEGCIYGLIGDNGAGKSTLLKLLAGHIFPTNGELCLFGETEEKALCNIRKNIGCLIEYPCFVPGMTVEQTLHYYAIQKMKMLTTCFRTPLSRHGSISIISGRRRGSPRGSIVLR